MLKNLTSTRKNLTEFDNILDRPDCSAENSCSKICSRLCQILSNSVKFLQSRNRNFPKSVKRQLRRFELQNLPASCGSTLAPATRQDSKRHCRGLALSSMGLSCKSSSCTRIQSRCRRRVKHSQLSSLPTTALESLVRFPALWRSYKSTWNLSVASASPRLWRVGSYFVRALKFACRIR